MRNTGIFFVFTFLSIHNTTATKLIEVTAVDNQTLVLHWQDGYIEYNWDDTISGSCNGWDYYHTENWHLCKDKDQYIPFGLPLHITLAKQIGSFRIISTEDENYSENGKNPVMIYRKSKVWEACYDEQKPAMHHWIYLTLPTAMKRGQKYALKISGHTNTDLAEVAFTYHEYTSVSPAIKISNIGYQSNAPHKSADVYIWMGDGADLDFSRHNNNPFHLYNTQTGENDFTGNLRFRIKKTEEPKFGKDFIGSAVWECDFSEFNQAGTYRLVIEGIGCSPEFVIDNNRFEKPVKTAMQGMFYQRMGCDEKPAGNFPYSRRPLFKQGVDPENFTVKISEKNMVLGDNPDNRRYYSSALTGEIARETWGGWADAFDNDQRPHNAICVFDILLTYYLNPAAFTDNQLYVPETDNGIPDIIDEALWQIDWWLRMRDSRGGYLTGLTNIHPPENINYAGAPCAWQGWNVAAASAMVADCFRLEGNDSLVQKYTKEALEAYAWAQKQDDQMLDIDIEAIMTGRDLKMTAAAFLYNLTGELHYEEIVKEESLAKNSGAKILTLDDRQQQYATLAYVFTPQSLSYPALQENMKKAVINQAKTDYMGTMKESPTKAIRYTIDWEGVFQTSSEVSLVALAHKISDNPEEKEYFERGLYAEAEWTLGRNPLGLIHMTGFGDKGITQSFAPGRRDGYPGLTPGWTPYMCRDGWDNKDEIVKCEWYTNRNYPIDKTVWPYGENYWNSRYSVPNGETTPQQTFRQKIVLYGYLYAITKLN